jgi:hypothetical protein
MVGTESEQAESNPTHERGHWLHFLLFTQAFDEDISIAQQLSGAIPSELLNANQRSHQPHSRSAVGNSKVIPERLWEE